MPRESQARKRSRASRIYEILAGAYPEARCALDHANPFELAVATILSAQCTDARVNQVTPELFRRFPDPESLAEASQEEVEALIHSTGFFRNKARNLIGMAESVVRVHGSEMPRTLAELIELPGVGRKTANVILGNAFGIDEGVVVDTHVKRIAKRLGLTGHSDPEKVEVDLVKLFPRDGWTMLAHLLIFHGRRVCVARVPRCEICPVGGDCPSFEPR